jgi:MFS family permease
MIFMGGTPIGAPIVGWVGETFGARWTLIGGGVATILGTLLAVVIFSYVKGIIGRRPVEEEPVSEDLVARSVA